MIARYTLKNGIPLFIVETHASPVVSIQAWVTRGSTHESDALAGISHFLEHALFKGTKRRKVGEVAAEIESRGGEINAFTSFEETAFYATLASRYFSEGVDIIADIMQNPLFDKDEIAREKEVILEEIKRAHDSPYKMVSMNLWQASFPGTPYGRPVLGFDNTVKKINHNTLRTYFTRNYHAGTMALFIVGDVDRQKAFELCQQKFGKIKKGPSRPVQAGIIFPKNKTARMTAISRDLKECHVQIGIPAPRISDPLIPALDLMCSAIGQGESSRMHQRLVKESRIAMEAHFGLMATSHCGLANLSLLVAPENVEAAVKECLEVIADVARHGLEQSEIERVKTSLESDVIGGKETVDGYARRLGYYYTEFGDPEYEGKYLQALLSVDRDRATDAIFQLFKNKPIVSIVHPEDWKADKKKITALVSRPILKPVGGAKENVRSATMTKQGSARLVTKSIDTLPIISVRLLFLGGSREEEKGKYGLGNLFGRLWTSGTRSFSSLEIARTLESLGASVHGFVGRNTCGVSIECLTKHWNVIKPLATEVLTGPTFPEREFATEKELVLREILSEKDSPGQLCQYNFLSAIYGNHPYGRSPLGIKETVSSLEPRDLQAFFKDYVHRKTLVVSSVGNFHPEMWGKEIEDLIKDLPASGRNPLPPFTIERGSGIKVIAAQKQPLYQSHVLIGFLGGSFGSPERYALKLLSSALAGQGGRLFLELRDRQSLAYTVSPMNSDSPEPGIFGFYIGCSPEKLERALVGIRSELEKILRTPIDARELERAKEYWIGRFELDMQRYAAQAMLFGLDEIYGLGYQHAQTVAEKIKSITAREIRDAALKFLDPKTATISIVHNAPLDIEKIKRDWEGAPAPVRRSRERTAYGTL